MQPKELPAPPTREQLPGWEGPIDTVYFTGPCEPVMNALAPAADGSWVLMLRDGGLAIVSSGG
jgi:hypothetical protein